MLLVEFDDSVRATELEKAGILQRNGIFLVGREHFAERLRIKYEKDNSETRSAVDFVCGSCVAAAVSGASVPRTLNQTDGTARSVETGLELM